MTGRGVKNYYPDEYWDFSKTGDENAQIYLEKCAKAGRTPKFPQFAGEPGYWKMLIDFKMYDNDGNGAPQRPVRPDVNMDEARRVLDEYKGGHAKLPVAKDVAREFLAEYRGRYDGEVISWFAHLQKATRPAWPLLLVAHLVFLCQKIERADKRMPGRTPEYVQLGVDFTPDKSVPELLETIGKFMNEE